VRSGKWEVRSGKWEVGSGKWEVRSGEWGVGSEKLAKLKSPLKGNPKQNHPFMEDAGM